MESARGSSNLSSPTRCEPFEKPALNLRRMVDIHLESPSSASRSVTICDFSATIEMIWSVSRTTFPLVLWSILISAIQANTISTSARTRESRELLGQHITMCCTTITITSLTFFRTSLTSCVILTYDALDRSRSQRRLTTRISSPSELDTISSQSSTTTASRPTPVLTPAEVLHQRSIFTSWIR